MVTAIADPVVCDDGDLGAATTPGTGFGIVGANLGELTMLACRGLGEALAALYGHTNLPNGVPGSLDFRCL